MTSDLSDRLGKIRLGDDHLGRWQRRDALIIL